jgi:MFS family permease
VSSFIVVWAGQLISLLGSATSAFALAVWLYGENGAIAELSLIAIAVYVPQIVISPYAGTLADRFDRRAIMLAADAGAMAATLAMLACAWRGTLSTPVALGLVALGSSCNACQWPAYESATVSLVPGDRLDRANGMLELSRAVAQLAAPLLGGAMLAAFGLAAALAFDTASFAIGIAALLAVRIPRHAARTERSHRVAEAWRVIADQSGLVAMLGLFAVTSFTFAVVDVALKPLVLASGSPWQLGVVLSMAGVGMGAGALAMTMWGGTRRRTVAILAFQLVEGGSLVLAGLRSTFSALCAAAFVYGLVIPLTFGCARTIWQLIVPAGYQGRVAALRNATIMFAIPIGYAAATPMAHVLALPQLVIAMGLVTWLAALGTYAFRPYRRLDQVCWQGSA